MADQLDEQLQQALEVLVPDEVRSSVRRRVMQEAGTLALSRPKKPKSPIRRPWEVLRTSALRPLALAGALLLVLFAGTAVAASKADPDSFLYPVKQKLEDARYVVAWQTHDRALVEIDHANDRLDEIQRMADADKPQFIPGLLSNYDAHMGKAQALIDEAVAGGEDASEAIVMIDATRTRHDEMKKNLEETAPEDVREALRESAGGGLCPIGEDDSREGVGGAGGEDDDDGDLYVPVAPGAPSHQESEGGGSHDSGGGNEQPGPSEQDPHDVQPSPDSHPSNDGGDQHYEEAPDVLTDTVGNGAEKASPQD